jgi:hypothetical protein
MFGSIEYNAIIQQGDIETGFNSDDFRDTFGHQESHPTGSYVCAFDSEGQVTVWTTTQQPHQQVIVSSLLS